MKQYSIGYTTGVFDMFHVGHLNILKKSKEKCDYLIVGVSTDELVTEYKHKRPVIPFEQRIEIVESIRYVDKVVPQFTLNKYEAWERFHFNVLFHGNDWQGSDIYNQMEKELSSVGVDIVFFEHTPGVSSTILRDVEGKKID